jgi:aspartate racemase
MIGVLGGMGPAATVDFMAKLIRLSPAGREQEHLPLVVISDPRVPDRVAPILCGEGEPPLPAMQAGIRALERAGAECVAIPCHTAHFWYRELAAGTALPILHIVDAVKADLERAQGPKGRVGLLATAATLHAGFYQKRLEEAGWPCIVPDRDTMDRLVLPAIALVKRDQADDAAVLLLEALAKLREAGAVLSVLACTELPIALDALPERPADCLDATESLARACIALHGLVSRAPLDDMNAACGTGAGAHTFAQRRVACGRLEP